MLLIKIEEKNKKDTAEITSYIRSHHFHETFVATIITIYRANLNAPVAMCGVRTIHDTSRQLT